MSSKQNQNVNYVAVLMGGNSAERDISLKTGRNVLAALQRSGVNAVGIDVGADITDQLRKQPIERAFIALHGKGGEDGTIQGMLEMLEIPYTGSGVMASALTLNKVITKTIWSAYNIPTPDYRVIDQQTQPQTLVDELGLPLCIKPIADGSTLGVTKVKSVEDIPQAIELASQFNGGVMAERWIQGRELTIGILDGQALPILEIITKREFYDYQAKYESDDNQYIVPDDFSPELVNLLQGLAVKAFKITGCSGWGRVDILLDQENLPWLIDLNTIPGMTEHSLVPKAAQHIGLSFDDVVMKILNAQSPQ